MGVGGQHHAPAALLPRDPVPIVQGAGWDPGPPWTENYVPPPLTGTFFILRRIQRDVIKKNYIDLQVSSRYSRQILMKFYFLDGFSKNIRMSNLIKFYYCEPVTCGRTDRQTDRNDEAH